MKKGIHPEYREVLFHDISVDEYFLISSTLKTDKTKEWEDGKTYPYYPLDVSSASHPFYTGKQKILDTGGRVQKFEKRFGKKSWAKVCQVTGKSPQAGNHVSHAKNRVKRKFFPNLHSHKFWVESENRFVTLKVSAKGMRVIDKKGIEEVLKDIRSRGIKV